MLHDGSRWMKTGDEATFEFQNGKHWIVIKDRLKELIKVLGNQVAPAELESILLGDGSVADCCIVTKPHDKAGEAPWAFVVAKDGKEWLDRELMKWVEEKVVRDKKLGGVTFVKKIEKNASGKILRRVYRDRFKREAEAEANLKAKL